MTIKINGKETETQSADLGQLAEELSLPAQGTAMALSGKMVPRQDWSSTPLSDGASVFIIKAAYGGSYSSFPTAPMKFPAWTASGWPWMVAASGSS